MPPETPSPSKGPSRSLSTPPIGRTVPPRSSTDATAATNPVSGAAIGPSTSEGHVNGPSSTHSYDAPTGAMTSGVPLKARDRPLSFPPLRNVASTTASGAPRGSGPGQSGSPEPDDAGMSTAAIIAVVVVALLLCLVAVVVVTVSARRRPSGAATELPKGAAVYGAVLPASLATPPGSAAGTAVAGQQGETRTADGGQYPVSSTRMTFRGQNGVVYAVPLSATGGPATTGSAGATVVMSPAYSNVTSNSTGPVTMNRAFDTAGSIETVDEPVYYASSSPPGEASNYYASPSVLDVGFGDPHYEMFTPTKRNSGVGAEAAPDYVLTTKLQSHVVELRVPRVNFGWLGMCARMI